MKNIINYKLINFHISVFCAKNKKTNIMIVPSDVWCNQNNFMQTFDNQGSEVSSDYKKALQSDPTLLQVISQMNGMMAEKGFPLKNLKAN